MGETIWAQTGSMGTGLFSLILPIGRQVQKLEEKAGFDEKEEGRYLESED